MVDADNHLSQGNYQEAIYSASAGLTWALNRVETAFVGRLPSFAGGILLMDAFGKPMTNSQAREGYRALERMQDTLLYITLGMNYTEYMQYKKFVGHVVFTLDGKAHNQGRVEPAEPSDVEFVVAYSINTVVQIEGIVGNIEAPFGSERWY